MINFVLCIFYHNKKKREVHLLLLLRGLWNRTGWWAALNQMLPRKGISLSRRDRGCVRFQTMEQVKHKG